MEKLLKGKAEKREWLIRRRWGFLSIGQANQHGNANTRILKRGDGYALLIRNTMFNDFEVSLYIPDEFRDYVDAMLERGKPYTIRVKRTLKNGYQVFITFEVDELKVEWNRRKVAGLDINPMGLATTIVAGDGNLLGSKWFYCPDLVFARRERRSWLIGNLVREVFRWLRGHGVNAIAMEDLNIKRTPDYQPWVNRLIANFVRKRLIQTIKIRAMKQGFLVVEVQPAYTSKVAKLKYAKMFSRFNLHQLAAFVIARRALGYGERLSEPMEIRYKLHKPKKSKLKNRVEVKHRIKVSYIWPSIYGHCFQGLMRDRASDGRIGPSPEAHGGSDRRVTPHSRAASDRMRRLEMREDAHQMRVGQQGIEVALTRIFNPGLGWELMQKIQFPATSSR